MTRWKYDADQHDPLTQWRIPVTSDRPEQDYTACFDRGSRHRPTSAEALLIVSYIEEYQTRWFGDGHWRQVQLAKPFDMDCTSTTVFHKWHHGDWSYRLSTWTSGPHWSPAGPRVRGTQYDHTDIQAPVTLAQLTDHLHGYGETGLCEHWVAWKAEHPEVFRSG